MLTDFEIAFKRRLRNRRLDCNITIQTAVDRFNDNEPEKYATASTWSKWESERNSKLPHLSLWPYLADALCWDNPRQLLPPEFDSEVKRKPSKMQLGALKQNQE